MGGAPRKGGAGRGDVPALSSESGGLRGGVQLQGEAGAALMKAANSYAWPEGTGGLSGTPRPRWQWSLPPTASLGTVWGQRRPFLAPLQGPRHTDLHTPSQCLLMPSATPRFCHSYNTLRFRRGLDQGPRGAGASGRPSTHLVWLFTSPWGAVPGASCHRWVGLDAKLTQSGATGLQRTKPGGAGCPLACAGGPVWPHLI